jgi:hypothetical protein
MDLTHVQRVRMLYKSILHLHRGLPTELRVMGNSYARDEFKRHKSCNSAEASIFMLEWAVGDFQHFCNNIFEVRLGYRFKLNCGQFSGHEPSS